MKDINVYKWANPPCHFAFWLAMRSHKWQLLAACHIWDEDYENMFYGFPMKGEI